MKTNQQVAVEVIAGKWDSGQNRINKLKAAGYDPGAVQSIVNALMSGQDFTPPAEDRILIVEFDSKKYDGLKVVFI